MGGWPLMPPVETAKAVYLEVVGGQVHLVYRIGGRRVDDGRCNIDDATHELQELSDDEFAMVAPERLCGHCFPDDTHSG